MHDTIYILLFQGMVIGLPPVLNFGKGELQKRVLDDVFSGKKASWRLKEFVDASNSALAIFSISVSPFRKPSRAVMSPV